MAFARHRRSASLQEPLSLYHSQHSTAGEGWYTRSIPHTIQEDVDLVDVLNGRREIPNSWRRSNTIRDSQPSELEDSVRRDHEISLGLFFTEALESSKHDESYIESREEAIASSFDEALWWEWVDHFIGALSDAARVSREDVADLAQQTTVADDSILDTYFLMLMDEAKTQIDRATAAFLQREWHRLGISAGKSLGGDHIRSHHSTKFQSREQQLYQLHAFLSRGAAWQWLSQRVATAASPIRWTHSVREAITRMFRNDYKHENDEGLHTAMFQVAWDPLHFVKEEFVSVPKLEKVITITGEDDKFQACTCGQYVQQTWPHLRLDLVHILQKCIESNFELDVEYQLENEASVKFQLLVDSEAEVNTGSAKEEMMHLKVIVQGSYLLIVEVGEQLAWLGAACTSSAWPDRACARVTQCSSKDDAAGSDVPIFDIKYEVADLLTNALSDCWRHLFRNPSIASGYPINRRESLVLGMEMTLELMIGLGDVIWAMVHNDNFMLKGFSSVFYPVLRANGMTTWHFKCENDGTHLAYSAAADSACGHKVMAANKISWLHDDRHIIGWARKTKSALGSQSTNYAGIKQPTNLASANFFKPSNLVLERAIITAGRYLNFGLSIAPGHKDRGIFRGDTKWLPQMVQYAEQQFVLLYDTHEKRAWLVDGASVLLHITCAQLKRFRHTAGFEPGLCEAFKYCDSGETPCSPSDCLLNSGNQRLLLLTQLERSYIKRTWTSKGKLKDTPIEEYSEWLLQDLMLDNWRVLSQIIEHQINPPMNGRRLRLTPRERLEGWSFKDIVDIRLSLEPKLVYLESSAKSWADLVHSTNVVTLMGTGFGEILRPAEGMSACPHWLNVPKDQDHLATTLGTLRALADQKGSITQFPEHLTDTLRWHQAEYLFGHCQASLNQAAEHCYRLQACYGRVKTRIRSWRRPVLDDDRPYDQDKAGVIFGSTKGEESNDTDESYYSLTPESSRDSQHSQITQPGEQDIDSDPSPTLEVTANELWAQRNLWRSPRRVPDTPPMQDGEAVDLPQSPNYITSPQQQTAYGSSAALRDRAPGAVAAVPFQTLRRMPKSRLLRANSF